MPIPLTTTNIPLPLVNTSIPRVYTITYKATDSSGNYTNQYRTVTIWALIRSIIFISNNISQASYAGGRNSTIINNNIVFIFNKK